MASTFYKYAERDADSQVNWAEVGKGISDMLSDTVRVREQKKEALDVATRKYQNELMNSPQGQNQDINAFINKFAHNMMNQTRIDEQLLKSGQMPLQKYTLRRQNYIDGTNQLFNLAKLYQEEHSKKMEGVTSGKLQAINLFNMKMVEGYADFNNSEAVIDSMGDGTVNIGLYETKIIDGKTVKVLSKNLAPVNVIRGKILQNVPTFDIEEATSKTVAAFGSRKDILYDAATTLGAGTITELMGPDFLATKDDPTTKKIVSDMSQAIDDQIGSYFANPYNLTSVLTQNTGKYSDESFTFDKDEAAKDKSKILVKIDPNTNMTTIDTNGPNYKTQYEEAKNWVRTNILSKIDQEKNVKTTPQSQLQERRPRTETELRREDEKDAAREFARQLSKLTVGDKSEAQNSLPYFQSLLEENGGRINRTEKGVEVITADGDTKFYAFSSGGKLQNPLELQRQLVTALNTGGLNDEMINRGLQEFYNPQQKINLKVKGSGYQRNIETEFSNKLSQISKENFRKKTKSETAPLLEKLFANYNLNAPDDKKITVTPSSKWAVNKIEISMPGAPTLTLNSNEDTNDSMAMKKLFDQWIENNVDKSLFLGGKKEVGKQTQSAKRTVAQIMQEDGVNFTEATKRFNAQ
jgi:hypothetical protein